MTVAAATERARTWAHPGVDAVNNLTFVLPSARRRSGSAEESRPLSVLCMLWSDRSGWLLAESCADVTERLWSETSALRWLQLHDVYAGRRVDGALAAFMLEEHARLARIITSGTAREVPELIYIAAVEAVLREARSETTARGFVVSSAIVFDDVDRCHLVLEATAGHDTLLTRFSPIALCVGRGGPGASPDGDERGGVVLSSHGVDVAVPYPWQLLIRYQGDGPLHAVPAALSWPDSALSSSLRLIAEECGLPVVDGALTVNELWGACEQGAIREIVGWIQPTLIQPVGLVQRGASRRQVGTGQPGPMLIRLWRRLSAVYRGQARDSLGCMHVVR